MGHGRLGLQQDWIFAVFMALRYSRTVKVVFESAGDVTTSCSISWEVPAGLIESVRAPPQTTHSPQGISFMANGNSRDERAERIERIREIVREDFDRVQQASSPFGVLNLTEDATLEEVHERYQRYERFYRAENFQRLGNMDLTRKALDVRRAVGTAMGKIQHLYEALEEDDHPTQIF